MFVIADTHIYHKHSNYNAGLNAQISSPWDSCMQPIRLKLFIPTPDELYLGIRLHVCLVPFHTVSKALSYNV